MRTAERRRAAIWRPGEPAFWVFLLITSASGVALVAEQVVFRDISRPGWVLAWALMLIYAAPVLVLALSLDLLDKEPASLLLAALAWGAIPAATLSALGNAGWGIAVARIVGPDAAAAWTASLVAPWVEEALKLCGLVLIYLIARRGFDDLMDGFVFGAMVGLGFSIVEDVFYFMGVFGGSPSDVLQGFFLRSVAGGFYGHLLYSGLAGLGFSYFVTRRGQRSLPVRLVVASGAFLAGVVAHLLWNSPWLDLFPTRPWSGADVLMLPVATVIKGLPFLLTVGLFFLLARRRERRWFDAVEAGPEDPALPGADLSVLRSPLTRRRTARDMRRRAGPTAARLLRRLQREQILLAMVTARATDGDDPDLERQRAECRALRQALQAMPGAASASG